MQIYYFVPLNKSTHAETHAHPLERTAIAGVDWPSAVPGIYPGGPINNGPMDGPFLY